MDGGYKTLSEIAEESGIPARTIRFYIARGLLDGPVKAGRGAAYTAGHLERLERIREFQAEGLTLSEIAARLNAGASEPAVLEATPWWQHAIADDVIVWVRAGSSPWRTKQLRAALDEFARRARPQSPPEEETT